MADQISIDFARACHREYVAMFAKDPDIVRFIGQPGQDGAIPRGWLGPDVFVHSVLCKSLQLGKHVDLETDFRASVWRRKSAMYETFAAHMSQRRSESSFHRDIVTGTHNTARSTCRTLFFAAHTTSAMRAPSRGFFVGDVAERGLECMRTFIALEIKFAAA